MDEKGKSILTRIFDLTYEQVGSELEALLFENLYINEFQPDLNTQVKIHPLDISKYQTKQIILFLPGITEHLSCQVKLNMKSCCFLLIALAIWGEPQLIV